MATPHYADVPQAWKYQPPTSVGPYRQAPPEYGGEWWYTSPFLQEPWKTQVQPSTPTPLGFTDIFGPKPHFQHPFYQEWMDNVETFEGVYAPPPADAQKVAHANELFTFFGMGTAAFYDTTIDSTPKVRWPQSGHYEYDSWYDDAISYPDMEVLTFQMRQVTEWGETPENFHPFFPPQLIPGGGQ